jgi:ATP-dependent DNA helicase RecG
MDQNIAEITGVGEKLAQKLNVLGIKSKQDLILNYPRKYDDFSEINKINSLNPGAVTIKAKIKQASGRYVRRGMHITEAIASDSTGSVRLVWFNQPYRAKALKTGFEYYISGNYELGRGRFAIMNPGAELTSNFPLNTARIVPIYRETKGIKSNQIRKIISSVKEDIEHIPEILPESVVSEQKLLPRNKALLNIHFPASGSDLSEAKSRLAFEEVFTLVLSALLNKKDNLKALAPKISFDEELIKSFVGTLPYKLTGAQRKVAWQIFQDLDKNIPANRLIEGDVGSGKTIVAAMVCLLAIKRGKQAAVMAPTEILARQHYQTFFELLRPIGLSKQIHLLLGSMKPKEKANVQKAIKASSSGLVVGTHSLIAEKADFNNLALVVIDEQHRFGVDQRKELLKKAGHIPHLISMTATPIPRSLALTVYGELDVSVIDELPPGRKRPTTKIISPNSKIQLYKSLEQALDNGRQMFVVCPLISESDSLHYLSAEEVYKDLSEKTFKNRRVALIHGKLKTEEKIKIMEAFTAGKIDILVSTTVIEVGVNIPNASIMLIEGVERFGLAQIHQLRGRIGRGGHQGYCYLLMSDSKPPSRRIKALESTSDGFKLAELDLEIRGPGAIYGAAQHGVLDLRLANINDTKLIALARNAAQKFLDENNLNDYPALSKEVYKNRTITSLN